MIYRGQVDSSWNLISSIYRDKSYIGKEKELANKFENHILDYADKEIWAEKTPKNIYVSHLFLDEFSDSKFIHIVRDPRDVILSLIGRNYSIIEAAERWYAIEESDLVFLSLGLIKEYKNIDVLIEAFNNIDYIANIKLLIVGKPDNDQLKREILNKVSNNDDIIIDFKFIPDQDIVKYLNTCDCMVTPYSLSSSLNSGVIYLSLSYKKPVISSAIGTVEDLKDKNYIFQYD